MLWGVDLHHYSWYLLLLDDDNDDGNDDCSIYDINNDNIEIRSDYYYGDDKYKQGVDCIVHFLTKSQNYTTDKRNKTYIWIYTYMSNSYL